MGNILKIFEYLLFNATKLLVFLDILTWSVTSYLFKLIECVVIS